MADRHIIPKEGLAKIAARMAAEDDAGIIWLGRYQWLQDVFCAKYGERNGTSAARQIRNTITAISRSPLFERAGYIRSVGFSARETLHPCFRLRTPNPKGQP
jgi:hypothetical protein